MKLLSSLFAASLLGITSSFAHHGQDFILLEDYHIPSVGSGHLMTNFEWENGSDGDEFGFSPSLMFGVLSQVALSVETDFRNEVATDWEYASVTPAIHIQLSPPDSKSPFRFGISAGYQFGNLSSEPAAEEAEGAEHEHAEEGEHGHDDADEGAGDDGPGQPAQPRGRGGRGVLLHAPMSTPRSACRAFTLGVNFPPGERRRRVARRTSIARGPGPGPGAKDRAKGPRVGRRGTYFASWTATT